MKLFKLSLSVFAAVLILFSSCSKKKDVTPVVTSKPISEYINSLNLNKKNTGNNGYSYEMGFKFSSSKSGKVTQLGSFMPKAGTYKVTLWNVSDKSVLAQASVVQSQDSIVSYQAISAVSIAANTDYMISINSNSSSYYSIYVNSNSLMPYTMGSITLKSHTESSGSSPVYPEMWVYTNYVSGLVDFVFVED